MTELGLSFPWIVLVASGLFLVVLVVALGLWVIAENQSGLVVKRFGPPLPSGRIIAMNSEAGYQARMLSPGWHFGYWRWRYKILKVPVLIVQPGDIALVVAADGCAIPPERVLARDVPCDNFRTRRRFCGVAASADVSCRF